MDSPAWIRLRWESARNSDHPNANESRKYTKSVIAARPSVRITNLLRMEMRPKR